jgi:ubiquitin-like 1-activating enzyme E1 A
LVWKKARENRHREFFVPPLAIVVAIRSRAHGRYSAPLGLSGIRAMAGASGDELTAEQRAVYDRQLRVWGVEAQRRLGQATFFVAGLTGLSAEACKNVVLAGIGSVVLFDDGTSAEDAHPGNFLAHAGVADHEGDAASLTAAEATAATLAQMNPFGTVTVARGDASASASEGTQSDFAGITEGMLKGVDVVLLGGASVAARERVGDLARAAGAKIFAGAVRGYAADFVADLGDVFEHVVETNASSEPTKTTTKTATFVTLRAAMSSSWSDLGAGRDGGTRRVNRLAAAATACAAFEKARGKPPSGKADLAAMIAEIPALELQNGLKPGWMKPEALVEYTGGADARASDDGVVAESPAVAAVAGGVLAQEMLRAVTKVGEPVRNAFFFSAADGQGTVENLGCGA